MQVLNAIIFSILRVFDFREEIKEVNHIGFYTPWIGWLDNINLRGRIYKVVIYIIIKYCNTIPCIST